MVGAEASLGEKAVAHGVRESADVSGSGEDGLVSEDGSVEAEDVVSFLDVFAPPVVFEVLFEFGSEGAIVPASVEAAVEFG